MKLLVGGGGSRGIIMDKCCKLLRRWPFKTHLPSVNQHSSVPVIHTFHSDGLFYT